ncbi:hypothetical protein [Flagellimonas pacifica]|uniref:Uncharacterized protein n=1 Tax=Flagellimonas pacifica TaxID=1247520 RepID=A0A285MS52_9FLAO|nr:hypothetical protein [Allomuricauda parva]SNZ00022.1 hypothetical protein SAMN06265377_1839 [Allomuricauda parva]
MLNEKSDKPCLHYSVDIASEDTRDVSRISQLLTPAQVELLNFCNPVDAPDLVKALKLVHNMALYHSDGLIDDPEKVALYWVKGLWECLEEIRG